MPKLRVHNVTVSLDGFAAGTDQRMDAPFGDGIDDSLHDWMFAAMKDHADGKQGTDVDFVARSEDNIGATIMGRNMFGPVADRGRTRRGPAGGATTRRSTTRCSCTRTTRVRRCR